MKRLADPQSTEMGVGGKTCSEASDAQAGTGKTADGDSSESSQIDTAAEREDLSKQFARVCSMDLPPDDPCVAFFRDKGMDLGTEGGVRLLAGNSPLQGKRWYLSVEVRGRLFDFLIDTGASHTMVSRKLSQAFVVPSDDLYKGITASTASGSEMQTYGRLVLPLKIEGRNYVFSPIVADIADDGILGLDFAALYGITLDPRSGRLSFELPSRTEFQCKLKRISSIAVVAQTCKIPAGHMCNVLIRTDGLESNRMGVVEPSADLLTPIGARSVNTLVQNVRRTVIPVCNLLKKDIKLYKGMVVGEAGYADRNGEFGSPEVGEVMSRLELGSADAFEAGDVTSAGSTVHGLPTWLESMFLDIPISGTEEKDLVAEVLTRHVDAFKSPSQILGRTDRVLHTIETGDARPIRIPYRRMPLSKKAKMEEAMTEMLEGGVIRPSTSPWSSPVQMTTKKDGTIRFCVDYRGLNGVTKKNAYPLPRIDECLDALGGNKWFSCLDLQSGYWQIGMHPDHVEKTAFSTQHGLFEFDRMPFGLCNAPAVFERMMEDMLRGLLNKVCLVYLDDIIVFGKTLKEAASNLELVLMRLIEWGLKLKPSKCKLFRREVDYLGRIVSERGIEANPGKILAVMTWAKPQTAKDVRSFLGFCSYYRDFIPGFSELAVPLQEIAVVKQKGNRGRYPPFEWTEKANRAFEALKLKFRETPVLKYPTEEGQFILDTDASNDSIGAALSQIQEGVEVPISFASNSLSKTQRNYCTTKRELLAIVVYTKKFRHYLYGGNFTIRTDHSSLRWLLNFKDAEGMIGRWLAHLSEFGLSNAQIEHRSGAKHLNADALSRIPVRRCQRLDCDDCGLHNAVIAGVGVLEDSPLDGRVFWSTTELLEAQLQDSSIRKVAGWLARGAKPMRPALSVENAETRKLVGQWPLLTFREDLLCRWKVTAGRSRRSIQMVVPMSLRGEVMAYCHGHRTSAHFGRKRTLEKIKRRYYWPGMGKDIARWVKHCPTCCLVKPGEGLGRSPLHQELFGVRFGRIAMDIISGFKPTPAGNTCMLVIQDYFTKYVRVIPLPDHTAVTCATAFVDHWVLTFGIPLLLHSDQGREFESQLFTAMCEYLTVVKQRTNPYRPQSDGQVERFNRTLIEALTALVDVHMEDWDIQSKYVVTAYNSTEHSSTGCSPNLMVFGDEILMPADVIFGATENPLQDPCPIVFVEDLRGRMREAYEWARKYLETTAERQKVGYDTGLKIRRFVVGEQVVRYHTPQAAIKLAPNWDGPYLIDTVISETTVLLRSARGRLYKSNVDRIRRWYGVELSQTVDMLQPCCDDTHPSLTDTGVKAVLTKNRVAGDVLTTVQAPTSKSREPARRRRKQQKEARLVQGVEMLDASAQVRKPRARGRPKSKPKSTPVEIGSRVVSTPKSSASTPIVETPPGVTDRELTPTTQVGQRASRRRKRRRALSRTPPVITPKTKAGTTGAPDKSKVPAGPITRARSGGQPPSACPGNLTRRTNATKSRDIVKQKVVTLPCQGVRQSARLAGKRVNT